MAFIAGLNLSSVRRLKKTWAVCGLVAVIYCHACHDLRNAKTHIIYIDTLFTQSVGSRSIATLHEIENTMNPEHNYQTYREMENKRRGQPFIPFLGLYLKDLTFANDGNAKTLDDGRTGGAQLVNFDKAWGVFGIIERAYQLQRIPYLLEDEGAATAYCKRLITIGEKQLYERSLLCEPRPPAEGSSGGGGEEFGLRSTLSRMLKSK